MGRSILGNVRGIAKRIWKPRFVKILFVVTTGFLSVDFLYPLNTSVSYSTVITARDGDILHAFLSRDGKWRLYAELPEITPTLRDAILFKEDRYFRYHSGFNPVSILRAGISCRVGERQGLRL